MAEVLGGTQLTGGTLVDLVERASKRLILISPYFRPWDRLTEAIKTAREVRGIPVLLLVRAPEAESSDVEALKEMRDAGVVVASLNRLHAKLYITHGEAILSSMNLLKSSALDSWEVGVRVTAKDDGELLQALIAQAQGLLRRADEDAKKGAVAVKRVNAQAKEDRLTSLLEGAVQSMVRRSRVAQPKQIPKPGRSSTRSARTGGSKKAARSTRSTPAKAFCIRCRTTISSNASRPLCLTCYGVWAKYSDPNYKEKVCHACGKASSAVSFAKPLCRVCYRAAG